MLGSVVHSCSDALLRVLHTAQPRWGTDVACFKGSHSESAQSSLAGLMAIG